MKLYWSLSFCRYSKKISLPSSWHLQSSLRFPSFNSLECFLTDSPPLDLQMADVHLFSLESNAKTLINHFISSIASTTPPLHDSSFFLNSFPEPIPGAVEPLAWPSPSRLPPLSHALAMAASEVGYHAIHEMGEGALLRELAFRSPCTSEKTEGKAMDPTYGREGHLGFNVSQKPDDASSTRGAAERRRKAVEENIMDVPSCIACAHQAAAPKEPKSAAAAKLKCNKSSQMMDQAEESKKKAGSNSSANTGTSMRGIENSARAEPPKQDFIHVRARRGQATDSHSLAERVRREKISERMKVLQDLVPGCSKISGKALMLDEIISYVQSLQHQVEFLSMKLASVNSRLDISLDGMFPKEMLHEHIIPSPREFDQELPPKCSLMTSSQANLNQPQGRCTNGLDSTSFISSQGNTTKSSTATTIFGNVNSPVTGLSSVWDELQNPY